MSKAVSRGQALQVSARVATQVLWDELDGDVLQAILELRPDDFGRRFTDFLRYGARVIVGEPRVLRIDRTHPFDPSAFIGSDWTIEEQDERALAITELNLSAVKFETMLQEGEKAVKGETKLERLKAAGYIRLDAGVLKALWDNQPMIPESWKKDAQGNTRYIYFDGTALRDPGGGRFILCLYWGDGRWGWGCYWLGRDWNARSPSAVLASMSA